MSITDPDQAYLSVLDMLHTRSLEGWDIPALMREVAECLGGLGMQLCRIHIGRPILHPLFVVSAYTWYPDNEVELDTYSRSADQQDKALFFKARFCQSMKVVLSRVDTAFAPDPNPTGFPCLSQSRPRAERTILSS